ncbi:hypothetical protein UFOVP1454_12 [uncultured Caudovirales phage]|uniref:Uncharacterized protein n=1 Tax=uncultured Caudovirales phage TaxID=2100421 RepID=A0A6J5SI67_9CAUD|nr:hypothetical protein UFOVP1454_12 [uncultured Caudovirales phage]
MSPFVYLKVAFVIVTFFAGWHSHSVYMDAKESKAIKLEIKAENKVAGAYETKLETINIQTQDLNNDLGIIYASDAYKCVIPSGGLRLLAKASR